MSAPPTSGSAKISRAFDGLTRSYRINLAKLRLQTVHFPISSNEEANALVLGEGRLKIEALQRVPESALGIRREASASNLSGRCAGP